MLTFHFTEAEIEAQGAAASFFFILSFCEFILLMSNISSPLGIFVVKDEKKSG